MWFLFQFYLNLIEQLRKRAIRWNIMREQIGE